eukprot:TRINITY_DN93187_c0_g1_i1.p1 TRINITY_DN93187_c0_g1~~TRINITY_DN93187_c0_g1_i1.p1  ORF type:complete len:206 (+),score=22.94 TRINITY_DN93187_c0_g1_i1:57-674(+)
MGQSLASTKRRRSPPPQRPKDLRRLLKEKCDLSPKYFDPEYDYVYTGKKARRLSGQRGGENYIPPAGWTKVALNVSKYEDEDAGKAGDWLRTDEEEGGWPVVYHGTRAVPANIRSIIRKGFKLRGGRHKPHNGAKFGDGIYCSPDPEYAKRYAEDYPLSDSDEDEELLLVFMCRARTHVKTSNPKVWLVQEPDDIRPCAVLFGDA